MLLTELFTLLYYIKNYCRYRHLTSNNFTGELPETLAKLTTLTEL